MGSELKLYQKKLLKNNMILEVKVWEVTRSKNYLDGVKYSLIVIDFESNKKVLMDNHAPKGHHFHIDNMEFKYRFEGIDKLIEDFKLLVFEHLGVKL